MWRHFIYENRNIFLSNTHLCSFRCPLQKQLIINVNEIFKRNILVTFKRLRFFVPIENFFTYIIASEGLQILTIARRSHGHWAFWGFFGVPHLLWHWASVYHGHRRGPVKLTPIAFSDGAVTTWFYDLGLSRLELGHPTFRLRVERLNSFMKEF